MIQISHEELKTPLSLKTSHIFSPGKRMPASPPPPFTPKTPLPPKMKRRNPSECQQNSERKLAKSLKISHSQRTIPSLLHPPSLSPTYSDPTNLNLKPPPRPPTRSGPLDQMTQIPDRQIDGKIHRQQDQHQEIIPPDQTRDEGESAAGMLQRQGRVGVARRGVPITGRQTAVHRAQGEEDEEEEDVGAEAGDQVDKRQYAHPEEEEGEGVEEGRVRETGGRVGGRVGAVGVVGRREGGAEGEPVGPVGAEDDEGEGVSEHEFEEAAGEH